jgi:RimJ/RimL family protein N-acetyltransferase
MPFTVPWTDDPALTEFLDYHEMRRREWSVDAWHFEPGVWFDGELVGVQALESTRFAETRTVGTGSWLGRRFQGGGVGTEMRTAVLELAFRGLGADRACSGAVDGNAGSLGVSEKLAYRVVGRRDRRARGLPAALRRRGGAGLGGKSFGTGLRTSRARGRTAGSATSTVTAAQRRPPPPRHAGGCGVPVPSARPRHARRSRTLRRVT